MWTRQIEKCVQMTPLISEIETAPLTLAQAAKLVPGRKRNPSTVWRWARHGKLVNGQRIRLEVLEVGRDWLTSKQALHRFFQRCTEARQLEAASTQPINDAHTRAEADLDAMGI